jgi:hypothetical protein
MPSQKNIRSASRECAKNPNIKRCDSRKTPSNYDGGAHSSAEGHELAAVGGGEAVKSARVPYRDKDGTTYLRRLAQTVPSQLRSSPGTFSSSDICKDSPSGAKGRSTNCKRQPPFCRVKTMNQNLSLSKRECSLPNFHRSSVVQISLCQNLLRQR